MRPARVEVITDYIYRDRWHVVERVRVEERKVFVEVEKRREVKAPDGTVTISADRYSLLDERLAMEASRDAVGEAEEASRSVRIETRDAPRWQLGGSAGVSLDRPTALVYGGWVGFRVAGPVWVQLSLDSALAAKVGAGLTF